MEWSHASYRYIDMEVLHQHLFMIYRKKNINKCFYYCKYNMIGKIIQCNLHKFGYVSIIIKCHYIILIKFDFSDFQSKFK